MKREFKKYFFFLIFLTIFLTLPSFVQVKNIENEICYSKMSKPKVVISNDASALAQSVVELSSKFGKNDIFTVAISGGSLPKVIFFFYYIDYLVSFKWS